MVLSVNLKCIAGTEFKQTRCESLDNGVLLIQFSSDDVKRRVSLNPSANLMTFKGTTGKDMKWASKLDEAKSFYIGNNSVLQVSFKDGRKFYFGKLDAMCIAKTKEHLGELYSGS